MNKTHLLVFLIPFLLISCNMVKKETVSLSVTVLGKDTNTRDNEKRFTSYPVIVSIRNDSTDTLKFWTMSCDHTVNFEFTRNDMTFVRDYDKCMSNDIPKLIILAPKEKFEFRSALDLLTVKPEKDIKMIFYLVREKEYFEMGDSVIGRVISQKRYLKKDKYFSKPIKYDW